MRLLPAPLVAIPPQHNAGLVATFKVIAGALLWKACVEIRKSAAGSARMISEGTSDPPDFL
jgi:hypothetical protein